MSPVSEHERDKPLTDQFEALKAAQQDPGWWSEAIILTRGAAIAFCSMLGLTIAALCVLAFTYVTGAQERGQALREQQAKLSEVAAGNTEAIRQIRVLTDPTPQEFQERLRENVRRCRAIPQCTRLFPNLDDTTSPRDTRPEGGASTDPGDERRGSSGGADAAPRLQRRQQVRRGGGRVDSPPQLPSRTPAPGRPAPEPTPAPPRTTQPAPSRQPEPTGIQPVPQVPSVPPVAAPEVPKPPVGVNAPDVPVQVCTDLVKVNCS
jgi:hypothetical protein